MNSRQKMVWMLVSKPDGNRSVGFGLSSRQILLAAVAGAMLLFNIPSMSADTLNIQIEDNYDDAHERGTGAFALNDTEIVVVSAPDNGGAIYRCGGVRFENITVPYNSIITAATVEVRVNTFDNMNITIRGQDNDDTLDFFTNQNIIDDNRPKTSAGVLWVENNVGENQWENSPDISNVIQEITDRSGWTSGNSLVIMFIANTDIVRGFRFVSHEGNPDNAAKLHITYFAPPSATTPEGPLIVTPGIVIRIDDNLTTTTPIENVRAVLNISDDLVYVPTFPENRDMGDFIENETKTARWVAATSFEEGTYSYNVTWEYDDNSGAKIITTENVTITVGYVNLPGVIDDGSLAMGVLAILIAIGAIAVAARSRSMRENNST